MGTHHQRNRLLKNLSTFDVAEIDRVFGGEGVDFAQIKPINKAPVQRVAIFTEAFIPKIDGVSKSAYLTLRYLQETGREVMVFAPNIAPTQVGNSRVVPLPSISMPFAPETMMAFPDLFIKKRLDDFKPDLIHLFSPALMCASGMIEARQRRIPVIANYQTDLPGYAEQHYGLQFAVPTLKWWLRMLHNRCHLNLVASPTTMNQLQKDGYRRLHLWRRGVDTIRFNPQHKRTEWRNYLLNGRDPNSLLVVYVGRLAPEKRLDLLLETAHLKGVALTIIGDGASRSLLEKQFAGTNTFFTGYLTGDDLAHAYASADVFIFPGPNETFGQVVQEAMSSGLPAVVVNRGGVRDQVTEGVNGFICPEDPHAFAHAILTLRDNRGLCRQMGLNARQTAERSPWTTVMGQLEDYYSESILLNNRYNRMYPTFNPLQRLLAAG